MGNKIVYRNNKELHFTKREYALVEYLAHNKNRTLSKEQIVNHVWSFDSDILPNTVEVFIRAIRKKLNDTDANIIETVRGFGYRMVAK